MSLKFCGQLAHHTSQTFRIHSATLLTKLIPIYNVRLNINCYLKSISLRRSENYFKQVY